MTRSGYNPVDLSKGMPLGGQQRQQQRQYTPEEMAEIEGMMREKAKKNLLVAFVTSQVSGLDCEFDSKAVVKKADELAEAFLDHIDAQETARTSS
jgi:hypothetical protein